MDPVNKAFTLASSVPLLVSSSISIANCSPQLDRVVHELEDRESDQTAYLSNKFRDIGVSSSMKGSSIAGDEGSPPTEEAGLPSFARTPTTPDSGWRPRGVLVAHHWEHHAVVNDIAISTDQSFFVSASDDSTVTVWDSRNLEKISHLDQG